MFIEESERAFTNQGQSAGGIMDFLASLYRYPEIPVDSTDEDIARLSFILQECIIQRLAMIKNEQMRLQLHHLVC